MTKICKHWSSSPLTRKTKAKGEFTMNEREWGNGKETVPLSLPKTSPNTTAKNWFSLGGWDL